MAVRFDTLVLVVFLLYLESIGSCYKLNVPKILLPYKANRPINFTLEATEGCFTWRSTKPEVASVQPIDDEVTGQKCSQRAIVTSLSMHPSRKTTIIFAEEQGTGHLVRCDVIVDTISDIYIETTTRILYLDDSPEEIEVRGQDSEGNVFSSLQGLEFEWGLISDHEGAEFLEANNVLRMLSFRDTAYVPLTHIAEFEMAGKQGDCILVEGITTGSAKISAKLRASGFKAVNASVVRLIVTDNLMLNPSHDVYILVHAQVHYQVEKIRHGKVTVLPMPSLQYHLEVDNTNTASLDNETLTVTGLRLGRTEVVLIDKNVKEPMSQPSAGIHVVEPKFLGFVVLPGRSYVLQRGNFYEILVEIYDIDSNKMFPSDNLRMDALFPKEYFKVLYSSRNGSYHRVQTLTSGTAEISASLFAVAMPDDSVQTLKIPVLGKQEVNIYDPLIVQPSELVFPWQPKSVHFHYQHKLKATGGTGNYTWSSSDKLVANVNVHGMVITATMLGETTVTAADMRNTAHTGSSKVHVLKPVEMMFADSRVEAELGTTLALPLTIFALTSKGGDKKQCTYCKLLPLEKQLSDSTIFKIVEGNDEVMDMACTILYLRAESIGHTRLTVTYQQGDTKLQASVTIAAYAPLKVLDPSDVAVVSLASSKRLVISGGPQPWVLDPSKYYRQFAAEKPNLVSMQRIKNIGVHKNYHLFEVTCLGFSEQTFNVTVGNYPATKNQFPAVAMTTVQFACVPPATLQLRPLIKQPALDTPCPVMLDSSNQIPVLMSATLEILVSAADSLGRQFDNFTSLVITWESTNKQLAILTTPQTAYTNLDGEILGSKILKANEIAVLMSSSGSVTLTATAASYRVAMFNKLAIDYKGRIEPPLSDFLDLLLVQETSFHPSAVTIFNHPSNKAELNIQGGSGHFIIKTSVKDITTSNYDEKKRTVEISPQHEGIQTITAYDLCLKMTHHASARVQVAGIDSVELIVVDKVQIEHEVVVRVRILDAANQPLVASVFDLVGLQLSADSDIISIRPDTSASSDPHVSQFIIHGRSLGTTKLVASATVHEGQIKSRGNTIQVFPPLRLHPRNVTLLVGSTFQVRCTGGPQPQSFVEFSIGHNHVGNISNSGIMEALGLGRTRITGQAVGSDGSGGDIIYSEDFVEVYVIRLADIRIYAPLLRLQTQSEMPVVAMGLGDNESPFTFGGASPSLQFHWSVSNQDVITVEPVFAESGVWTAPEHNVAMRVHTKNAGEALLKLRVTTSPGSHGQILHDATLFDDVQIQVFEKLTLTHPTSCDSTLLLTPNTYGQIKTNRDGSAAMSYSILSGKGSSIISVSHQGVVTSGDQLGEVSVLVVAHERFGLNQTTIVLVKVKLVLYVSIHCDTRLMTTDKKLHVFPVGLTLTFSAKFFDNVGELFDATNVGLEHRLNRYDLLQLQPGVVNTTFVARVMHHGASLFKVWDMRNPRIDDYVNVAVGSVVIVDRSITVGDVLKFTTPLLTGEGQRGTWTSSDLSVIRINSDGVALATGPGTCTLDHKLADGFVTHGQVTVEAIQTVILDTTNVPILSDVYRETPIEIPVQLSNTDMTQDIDSNVFQQASDFVHPMFTCRLDSVRSQSSVLDLFQVFPGFNSATGKYYCSIQQIPEKVTPFKTKAESQLSLVVIVNGQKRQNEVRSYPVTLTFLPSFRVQAAHDPVISVAKPVVEFQVTGADKVLQNLKVSWNATTLISVGSPVVKNLGSVSYHIKLVESTLHIVNEITVDVEFRSQLINQAVVVSVRVAPVTMDMPSPKKDPLTSWSGVMHVISSTWILSIILIIIMICMLIIGYHAFNAPRIYDVRPDSFLVHTPPPAYSPQGYHPSPLKRSSPYAAPYDTHGTSPRRRPRQQRSPTLWSTSGYDPQEGASTPQ